MAKKTNINLRQAVIYQIFVRQHSLKGDFNGVVSDLDRIKNMGVDYIYLLPIHEIGTLDRKGTMGSPYAIKDYYSINSSYGNLDDFIHLKDEINKRGMKLIIDIVFNHTSRDSILTKERPDWFCKKASGEFANRVGEWSDITDLDFSKREVWHYLIDVLKYWAQYTDGIRCDVAPLIPIEFWVKCKREVSRVNKKLLWITESVEPEFIKYIRDLGYDASSDSMMYEVFDIAYDYDIFGYYKDYLSNHNKLSRWIEEIYKQESIYPKNYIKLRGYENHDQERLAFYVTSKREFLNFVALFFFLRGIPFIYAGMEHMIARKPLLFEKDPIPWSQDNSVEEFIKSLSKIHKSPLITTGVFNVLNKDNGCILTYSDKKSILYGIFNINSIDYLTIDLPDGTYQNLINNKKVQINNQIIKKEEMPAVFKVKLQ